MLNRKNADQGDSNQMVTQSQSDENFETYPLDKLETMLKEEKENYEKQRLGNMLNPRGGCLGAPMALRLEKYYAKKVEDILKAITNLEGIRIKQDEKACSLILNSLINIPPQVIGILFEYLIEEPKYTQNISSATIIKNSLFANNQKDKRIENSNKDINSTPENSSGTTLSRNSSAWFKPVIGIVAAGIAAAAVWQFSSRRGPFV